ncbi:MAG: hypothetical protein KGD68_08960 [Candidatus Lokiarchaeota archaeon]|nr:hypothetical protein [Candidatus Lokiarchaeota archaeon]
MTKSLMLKCKICSKEEEIIGISYEYYMLYYFVPNEVDEICGSCGNESLVPINPMKIEHCEYCGVKQCEFCGVKHCEDCGAMLCEYCGL